MALRVQRRVERNLLQRLEPLLSSSKTTIRRATVSRSDFITDALPTSRSTPSSSFSTNNAVEPDRVVPFLLEHRPAESLVVGEVVEVDSDRRIEPPFPR